MSDDLDRAHLESDEGENEDVEAHKYAKTAPMSDDGGEDDNDVEAHKLALKNDVGKTSI